MGEVYRARDESLGRDVALKILPPKLAEDAQRLARFEREARVVAALDHPNVVTLYSVDEADGFHFLTMELVAGRTIGDLITPGGLSLERFLDLAIPMTLAISVAHEKGILHRDLKPANVMVSDAGVVKVLDFGLAEPIEALSDPSVSDLSTESLDQSKLVGTVPYMSPEHLQGRPADRRSDIFSLGVIFYEMATGRRPFAGCSSAEIVSCILRDAPPPIEETRGDLPSRLSHVLQRCLRKDPQRRWQTARDLHNELLELREELASGAAQPRTADHRHPSIAVLPFVDMSPTGDQGHLADGLAEDLINSLSQIRDLRVPARTSSFVFKGQSLDVREIGGRLGVVTVLEGSVQMYGSRLRVTASLIQVSSGYTLWSQSFDREVDDVFRLQDEITRAIIAELEVPLRREERSLLSRRARRTVDRDVYALYLEARAAWADRFEGRLKEALEKFSEVTQREPRWAPAYAGVADCYNVLGWYTFMPSRQAFELAGASARKALELDPAQADAHASAGLVQTLYHRDWARAEKHFTESIELRPMNPVARWWYAFCLVVQGRTEAALAQGEYARTREDPLSRATHANVGWLQHLAGDTRTAIEQLQYTARQWPDFALTYVFLGWAHEQTGDLDLALGDWARAEQEFGRLGAPMPSLALQKAHTLALAGRREEAGMLLQRLDRMAEEKKVYFSPVNRAAVHVALSELDEALARLAVAEEINDCWLVVLGNDPRFGPLHERRARELAEIVRRANLPCA
jgi:serine/threonine protein kinase/Tfp pilus assembly protein PilF